jgi:rfaE bifunctional protein kinase chain/domain
MNKLALPDPHPARILVVGDVMLDRYWFGEVSRISPEAPVPVVKVERTEERPGGAANVARNCGRAGRAGRCCRWSATTRPGAALERLLPRRASPPNLHRDAELSTTVKLRVIGRQQQLLRIDFETAPGHEVLASPSWRFRARCRRLRRGDPVRLRQGRPGAHRRA